MIANKRTGMAKTKFMTIGTSLASHVRVDIDNPLSFSLSFVADERLKLVETPAVQPSVPCLALHEPVPTISYSFKVFQSENIGTTDYLFANSVVDPAHVTFLSTRHLSEMSQSGLRAFSLESFPEIMKLHEFGLLTFEDPTVTAHSEIVFSEVNPENLVATRIFRTDLFRECDMEEHSTLSVCYDFESLISPREIFSVILWNNNRNILPTIFSEGSDSHVSRSKCEQFSVKEDRARSNVRHTFQLKFLRSFSDCATSEICWQPLPQIFIDETVKFKSITNLSVKSTCESVSNCLEEGIRHLNQFRSGLNFNLNGGNDFHIVDINNRVYKHYGGKVVSSA